jgi:hypothetical protein
MYQFRIGRIEEACGHRLVNCRCAMLPGATEPLQKSEASNASRSVEPCVIERIDRLKQLPRTEARGNATSILTQP